MLYWRELGPQSGQYSINIGVKVSIKFTFSSISTTHIVYLYENQAAGVHFYILPSVLFLCRRAANVKTALVPCLNLSEFRSLIVCAIAITYTILQVTHVKRNNSSIKFLAACFPFISLRTINFHLLITRKNCINNNLSNWRSC